MKYRPQRGLLADAMAEVVELADRAALVDFIRHDLACWPTAPDAGALEIHPYGYDERIDWTTHIVTLKGFGVLGFTDGPG